MRPQLSKPNSAACRLLSVAAVLMLMFGVTTARAQEWQQYLAFDDSFSIDFPGEPAIVKTNYKTEYGITLPARVYTAKDEFGTYKATAVDWSTAQAQHKTAFEACKASVGADLKGGENPGICSESRYGSEIRSATLHAMGEIIKRGGKLIYLSQNPADGVEGLSLELINNDQSVTFAQALWHEGHLYIAEATAPKGAPPPSAFPVSIQFLDKEGRRIRYNGRYSPLSPAPQRTR